MFSWAKVFLWLPKVSSRVFYSFWRFSEGSWVGFLGFGNDFLSFISSFHRNKFQRGKKTGNHVSFLRKIVVFHAFPALFFPREKMDPTSGFPLKVS